MALYFATVLPGLEPVLENEMKAKIADVVVADRERGKVYFYSSLPLVKLKALRTADNLYKWLCR